jgi:hypothetical protein
MSLFAASLGIASMTWGSVLFHVGMHGEKRVHGFSEILGLGFCFMAILIWFGRWT